MVCNDFNGVGGMTAMVPSNDELQELISRGQEALEVLESLKRGESVAYYMVDKVMVFRSEEAVEGGGFYFPEELPKFQSHGLQQSQKTQPE